MGNHDDIVDVPAQIEPGDEGQIPTNLLTPQAIKELDVAIECYKQLKVMAAKLTNHQDWTSQQGKPYLDASGCEKIKNPFGVGWHIESIERLDRKDKDGNPYYIIRVMGTVWSRKLGGSSISAVGMRRSNEDFFAVRYKDGKQVILPMDEVDEENITQAAISNFEGNGVKRLIGLRNMTWEELANAGIKQSEVTAIQYRKGGAQAQRPSGESQHSSDSPPAGKSTTPRKVSVDVLLGEIEKADSVDALRKWRVERQRDVVSLGSQDKTRVLEAYDKRKIVLDEREGE